MLAIRDNTQHSYSHTHHHNLKHPSEGFHAVILVQTLIHWTTFPYQAGYTRTPLALCISQYWNVRTGGVLSGDHLSGDHCLPGNESVAVGPHPVSQL